SLITYLRFELLPVLFQVQWPCATSDLDPKEQEEKERSKPPARATSFRADRRRDRRGRGQLVGPAVGRHVEVAQRELVQLLARRRRIVAGQTGAAEVAVLQTDAAGHR